jgi:hypothetical protein
MQKFCFQAVVAAQQVVLATGNSQIKQEEPPTLYEYFGSPNNASLVGLVAEKDGFK